MNADEKKKKIIMLFIALGLILSVIFGVTFSYLAPTISNLENESTVAFNAGVIAIDFKNGTSQIEVSDILPGWSETKKFSLIATNTTSIRKADAMNYSLKLIVESNTFSDNAISVSLKSTNTSNNGTIAEIIPKEAKEINNGARNGFFLFSLTDALKLFIICFEDVLISYLSMFSNISLMSLSLLFIFYLLSNFL